MGVFSGGEYIMTHHFEYSHPCGMSSAVVVVGLIASNCDHAKVSMNKTPNVQFLLILCHQLVNEKTLQELIVSKSSITIFAHISEL